MILEKIYFQDESELCSDAKRVLAYQKREDDQRWWVIEYCAKTQKVIALHNLQFISTMVVHKDNVS